MPRVSQPRIPAALAAARMTAFRPGQSPPPVTIPMRLLMLLVLGGHRHPCVHFTAGAASHVVGLGRTASPPCRRSFLAPFPAQDKRMVFAALIDVVPMLDEGVADGLLGVSGA